MQQVQILLKYQQGDMQWGIIHILDQHGIDYLERGQSPNMEHRPLQRPQPQCQSQVQTSVTRDSIFHVLVPSVSRRKLSAVPWLQNKNESYQMHRQCIGEVFVPDDEHEKAVCISVQFLLSHLSVERFSFAFSLSSNFLPFDRIHPLTCQVAVNIHFKTYDKSFRQRKKFEPEKLKKKL